MAAVIVELDALVKPVVLAAELDFLITDATVYSVLCVKPVKAVPPLKYFTLSPTLNSCSLSVVTVAPADEAIAVVSEVMISLIQFTVASSKIFVGTILFTSFNSAVTLPPLFGFMVSV